jgi:hypothetical protein
MPLEIKYLSRELEILFGKNRLNFDASDRKQIDASRYESKLIRANSSQ